jgi:hypothetical protein
MKTKCLLKGWAVFVFTAFADEPQCIRPSFPVRSSLLLVALAMVMRMSIISGLPFFRLDHGPSLLGAVVALDRRQGPMAIVHPGISSRDEGVEGSWSG